MHTPRIRGVIDRRILANYRVDPIVIKKVLPAPFRPKLVNGFAIAGICLIRLKQVRPFFFPIPWGLQSENAAHRIAVEWDSNGQVMEGVFVPRRDTSSWLNCLAGGRVFPGLQHHAKFKVHETKQDICVSMQSDDCMVGLTVEGTVAETIDSSSGFKSLSAASDFFQRGAIGYSTSRTFGRYDGMELCCDSWKVKALWVSRIQSSFFGNADVFPVGSIEFDCALLMRNIQHEWHARCPLCC